jgi:hypothetical protein
MRIYTYSIVQNQMSYIYTMHALFDYLHATTSRRQFIYNYLLQSVNDSLYIIRYIDPLSLFMDYYLQSFNILLIAAWSLPHACNNVIAFSHVCEYCRSNG